MYNSRFNSIKGVIFDYGGTIDTPAVHWSEVLWQGYLAAGVPVSKEQFREAYVHGERTLARMPLIQPQHTFFHLLVIKVDVEMRYLVDQGYLAADAPFVEPAGVIASYCYDYVLDVLKRHKPVLETLSKRYPMVLVSNFYGNVHAVLEDFGLDGYFQKVVESAVVGVRKPDPRIFELGVEALGLPAEQVVVIGDSFSKDILPARQAGCKTVWMKGIGWGNEVTDEAVPDAVLTELPQVLDLLLR